MLFPPLSLIHALHNKFLFHELVVRKCTAFCQHRVSASTQRHARTQGHARTGSVNRFIVPSGMAQGASCSTSDSQAALHMPCHVGRKSLTGRFLHDASRG